MNLRYMKTISPISGSGRNSITKYIEDVKNGTNKVLVKSIRKANKAKDLNQMKIEMDKLPLIGYGYQSNVSHLDWNDQKIIQIEILDVYGDPQNSMCIDRHTMIEHRNVLDNGNILWFYYTGPKYSHNDAIDTLVLYIKEWNKNCKINLGKIKDPQYQFEIGYDPRIYTNTSAEAFNFKYWKKKFESIEQKVA